jgi:hypothetical protein
MTSTPMPTRMRTMAQMMFVLPGFSAGAVPVVAVSGAAVAVVSVTGAVDVDAVVSVAVVAVALVVVVAGGGCVETTEVPGSAGVPPAVDSGVVVGAGDEVVVTGGLGAVVVPGSGFASCVDVDAGGTPAVPAVVVAIFTGGFAFGTGVVAAAFVDGLCLAGFGVTFAVVVFGAVAGFVFVVTCTGFLTTGGAGVGAILGHSGFGPAIFAGTDTPRRARRRDDSRARKRRVSRVG